MILKKSIIKLILKDHLLHHEDRVKLLLRMQPDVIIKRIDETGEWVCTLSKEYDDEVWLDVFNDLDSAVDYVNKNGLKLGVILG